MATPKGPSEGGSGGKRGHRNMEHWGFNDEVKDAARSRRRLDDRDLAAGGTDGPVTWRSLAGEEAELFEREADIEVGPGHELTGVHLKAIGACPGCDDVLFRLQDESFVIVSLTWSSELEPAPQPAATRVNGYAALDVAIALHGH